MYLTFYQKRNGKTIVRVTTTPPHYEIGQNTSMGWYVLDIQYLYEDKFYTREKHDALVDEYIRKRIQRRVRKRKIRKIVLVIERILNGRRESHGRNSNFK